MSDAKSVCINPDDISTNRADHTTALIFPMQRMQYKTSVVGFMDLQKADHEVGTISDCDVSR
jgi:hypothetical protein